MGNSILNKGELTRGGNCKRTGLCRVGYEYILELGEGRGSIVRYARKGRVSLILGTEQNADRPSAQCGQPGACTGKYTGPKGDREKLASKYAIVQETQADCIVGIDKSVLSWGSGPK